VLLNVATPEAARDGYETLVARAEVAGVAPEGVLVAPMAAAGVETILGVQRDPLFGPAVMFGLGGVLVEVLGDVAFRLAPFGLDEAHRMIREIKGFKVLQGVRGAPPADLEALAEALVRLSVLAAAEAERIESIDVNPFLVLPEGQGAVALDALIVLRVGSEAP
jgi:acyl-CoA synthetase (NDP forming)